MGGRLARAHKTGPGGRCLAEWNLGQAPPTQTGLLVSSIWTVVPPITEQSWRQAAPIGAGQRVLGAWAAPLIRPISTVILPIAEQGQRQAVARAARHLALPTAWGGTAWPEANR